MVKPKWSNKANTLNSSPCQLLLMIKTTHTNKGSSVKIFQIRLKTMLVNDTKFITAESVELFSEDLDLPCKLKILSFFI